MDINKIKEQFNSIAEFDKVDCVYNFMKFGVVIAIK